MKGKIGLLMLAILMVLVLASFPIYSMAVEAVIWTDKSDYTPGETVIIHGANFASISNITITILRPDNTIDTLYIASDDEGKFIAEYQLDGIEGEYKVTATDGINTAETTFTDAVNINWVKPSGSSYPPEKENFLTTEDVYAVVYSGSGSGKNSFRIYIVSNEPITGKDLNDTSGGYETFTIDNQGTHGPFLIWKAPTKAGTYYIVVDDNENGKYDGGDVYCSFTISTPLAELKADLSIVKSGPYYAHVGDEITFTFSVNNSGPDSAANVAVTDDKAGKATYVNGDTNGNGMLDVVETWIFTATYKVLETDPDPLVNTAEVTSEVNDPDENNNQATWTVDILHPNITVSKSGPQYAHEGDTITYTITITNPSTDTIMYKVSVVDSLLGNISASFPESLAPGASETKTFTYNVPSPSGDITNTVTVKYKDDLNFEVTKTASWSIDVLHPSIDVIKTANVTMIHEGDWVEYNVTVVNTGDCNLTVTLEDELLGISWSGTLKPGEKHEEIVPIQPTEDPTENTANATGTDALGGKVSDSASWKVDILHPKIMVTKVANVTRAYAGYVIEYTINVINIGDCPLYNVNVTDTLLGTLPTNGFLGVGESESKTFTKTYTVEAGDSDPLVNNVTAEGKDALGLFVSANASASVDLIAKICGYKFYDANANGVWDYGELGVAGIKIELWLGGSKINEITTGSDGSYCFDELDAGNYTIVEVLPDNWANTTPTSITVELKSGEISKDNNFGNVCLKPGYGGRTLGYWANAGNKLITKEDVIYLNSLNLYKPSGWYPPFTTNNGNNGLLTARSQIRTYLLRATARDMRWMLSAQLIATALNVRHRYLSNSTIVYVGPSTYVPSGFITIEEIIINANTALSNGAEQEYWKNILDALNNNRLKFVCQNPC
ncbi:MAG: SdrD B-like domain-containing protein [Candidatus Bathyarchaeia archaeon]